MQSAKAFYFSSHRPLHLWNLGRQDITCPCTHESAVANANHRAHCIRAMHNRFIVDYSPV